MLENDKNNKLNDTLTVLIDLIPDPVVVVDYSGKIKDANKMAGKFAGYQKEDLIEKSFSSLSFISEEYKQLITKNVKERLTGSNIPPYEIKITAKNGEVKMPKGKRETIHKRGRNIRPRHFTGYYGRKQNST